MHTEGVQGEWEDEIRLHTNNRPGWWHLENKYESDQSAWCSHVSNWGWVWACGDTGCVTGVHTSTHTYLNTVLGGFRAFGGEFMVNWNSSIILAKTVPILRDLSGEILIISDTFMCQNGNCSKICLHSWPNITHCISFYTTWFAWSKNMQNIQYQSNESTLIRWVTLGQINFIYKS